MPAIKGAHLKEHGLLNEPKGPDFGAGPTGCGGTPTVFDSQATTPILQALPPFLGPTSPSTPSTGSIAAASMGSGG